MNGAIAELIGYATFLSCVCLHSPSVSGMAWFDAFVWHCTEHVSWSLSPTPFPPTFLLGSTLMCLSGIGSFGVLHKTMTAAMPLISDLDFPLFPLPPFRYCFSGRKNHF